MEIFLKDADRVYTYDQLLDHINKASDFCPEFQDKNLFAYFSNLLLGLASGNDIYLVDSDFSNEELKSLALNKINEKKHLDDREYSDFKELLETIRESDAKITIFTSGTTGQPKKVTHSYASLSRAVKTGTRFADNVWGFAYNPTHMAGLQVFLQALENRNQIVNIFNLTRAEVYSAIDSNHITHISATPTFYRLLLPYEREFDSVKRITLGGEKASENLYNAIHRIFPTAKITNVYASTEAGTLFASKGSDFVFPKNRPHDFKIIDSELYIHKSLLGKSESLKLIGDFYPTGDLIEWVNEAEGLFRFKSRKNELINVGGYKINPQEVEDAIREISGVTDVYVFGKANSVLGNILCANIVKDNTSDISEIDIRKLLSEKLQDFKIPRFIKFVDKIDLTRTGKMKRI